MRKSIGRWKGDTAVPVKVTAAMEYIFVTVEVVILTASFYNSQKEENPVRIISLK